MHELSLCTSVADTVLECARREGVRRVTRVVLEIGTGAPVMAEALRFAFPLVAANTLLEGATLEIRQTPLTLRCQACGHEHAPRSVGTPCPACGGSAADVLAGREMRVLSFEAE